MAAYIVERSIAGGEEGSKLEGLHDGNKYILTMYDYDTNYIKGVPVKSRKAEMCLEAFKTMFDELTAKEFKPELVHLDNEASKLLCDHIEAENVDIQLVTPGNHRNNPAEQAI